MARQKTARREAAGERKVLRLRQLRRACEMSQTELGRRVGLSAPAIASIESGRTRPSFDKGMAIAAVFNLPTEEVFSYVEVPAYDTRPTAADVLDILKATK